MPKSQLELYLEHQSDVQSVNSPSKPKIMNSYDVWIQCFSNAFLSIFINLNIFYIDFYSLSILIWQQNSSRSLLMLSQVLNLSHMSQISIRVKRRSSFYYFILGISLLSLPAIIYIKLSFWYKAVYNLWFGCVTCIIGLAYVIGYIFSYVIQKSLNEIKQVRVQSLSVISMLKSVQSSSLSLNISHPMPPISKLEESILLSGQSGHNAFECAALRQSLCFGLHRLRGRVREISAVYSSRVICFTRSSLLVASDINALLNSSSHTTEDSAEVVVPSCASLSALVRQVLSSQSAVLVYAFFRTNWQSDSFDLPTDVLMKLRANVQRTPSSSSSSSSSSRRVDSCDDSIIISDNNLFRWVSVRPLDYYTLLSRHLSPDWLTAVKCALCVVFISWNLFATLSAVVSLRAALLEYRLALQLCGSHGTFTNSSVTEVTSDRSSKDKAAPSTLTHPASAAVSAAYFETRVDLLRLRRKYENIVNKLWLCEHALSSRAMLDVVCSLSAPAAECVSVPTCVNRASCAEALQQLSAIRCFVESDPLSLTRLKEEAGGAVSCSTDCTEIDDSSAVERAADRLLLDLPAKNELVCIIQKLVQMRSIVCRLSVGESLGDTNTSCSSARNMTASTTSVSTATPTTAADCEKLTNIDKVVAQPSTASDTIHSELFGDDDCVLKGVHCTAVSRSHDEVLSVLDAQGRRMVDVYEGSIPSAAESPTLSAAEAQVARRKRREDQLLTDRLLSAEKSLMSELLLRIEKRLDETVERVRGDCCERECEEGVGERVPAPCHRSSSPPCYTQSADDDLDIKYDKIVPQRIDVVLGPELEDQHSQARSGEHELLSSADCSSSSSTCIAIALSSGNSISLDTDFKAAIALFRNHQEVAFGDSSDDEEG